MSDLSMFLFARPSFLEGAARVWDLGNTLCEYNTSESGWLADYRAMQADGRLIASDLRQVLEAGICEQKQEGGQKK